MKKATSSTSKEMKSGRKLKETFNKKAEKPISGGRILPISASRKELKGQRFVITSAQNNTDIHPGLMKALEAYCRENNAQLLITRFTYNKAAYSKGENGEVLYDPAIEKYSCTDLVKLGDKVVVFNEMEVKNPTADDPFSRLDSYASDTWGITPYPKFAMKSVAGVGLGNARFLYTTGTCTMRNYKADKAGAIADEQHNYGALVVEVDEDGRCLPPRQLSADDTGAFQDLTTLYKPDGTVLKNQRVEAIQPGDIHVEKGSPLMNAAMYGKGGIMDALTPKYQFLHDLLDFTSRNHHNIKDPAFIYAQHLKGATVEGDIDLAGAFLKSVETPGREDVVVQSNHDEAYHRWLREYGIKIESDPANAEFYHESKLEQIRKIKSGEADPNMLEWAIRRKFDLKSTTFLVESGDPAKSDFRICKNPDGTGGIQCALHGHSGPNGAKGSPAAFKVAGNVNTGHTHSAGIVDGVFTAGVQGRLDQGYNVGPSSWSHSFIVTYPSGQRAVMTMRPEDGRSCLDINPAISPEILAKAEKKVVKAFTETKKKKMPKAA